MKFNINRSVKVKLTEEGRRMYRNYCKEFTTQIPTPPVDADGYSPFQLWGLMAIFGSHLQIGGPVLFESNEIVIEPEK